MIDCKENCIFDLGVKGLMIYSLFFAIFVGCSMCLHIFAITFFNCLMNGTRKNLDLNLP